MPDATIIQRPRILALLQGSSSFGRGVLRGVARFARTHGSWQFMGLPRDAVPWPKPGTLKLSGVISQGATEEAFSWADQGVPVVNVSNTVRQDRFPSVISDDVAVGRLVADDLAARAFRNFAFIGTPTAYSEDRQTGFTRQLARYGRRAKVWVYPVGPAWEETQEILRQWLARLPLPTAIMCCNDVVAWRTLDCIREVGLRVPEDLAVVGVDDDETLCDLASPPISSVRIASETIGYHAATALSKLMQSRPGRPRRAHILRIPPLGVTHRRSSDVLSIDDPAVTDAMHFIARRAADPIRVTDVLDAVPVSRRLLERRFRAAMGRTILQEIHRQHLLRAQNLLIETNLDLERVATMSGFSNAKQMGAIFRHELRTTPTAVRRAI